ncbi:MAG TPA: EthD family reductase [Sphingobium sp.]
MTVALHVIYPSSGTSHFDQGYYAQSHAPLVQRLLEPEGLRALRISAPATNDQPFHLMATLVFDDLATAQAALGKHQVTLHADIANFSSLAPTRFLAIETD